MPAVTITHLDLPVPETANTSAIKKGSKLCNLAKDIIALRDMENFGCNSSKRLELMEEFKKEWRAACLPETGLWLNMSAFEEQC